MSPLPEALLDAAPWIVAPLVVWWRARASRSLDEFDASPPADAPLVSVIVPARDEARNVATCLTAILASDWPRLEVLLVDDGSTDGTGDIARTIAHHDARLRVLDNPPLPDGWFGKQWACATGARSARGAVLLFADADTVQAPDLVPRAVRALRDTSASPEGYGLLSVAGTQEMRTFWERAVQPQVLAVIAGRFGGSERVTRSRRAVDKIANGQCLMVDRAAYDAMGGHAAVRDVVVEDLKLAQRMFASGREIRLIVGERQLRTRMYTSLGELVAGWRKNVYAGGREAMPLGRFGQLIFPLLLLVPALMQLWPVARLAAAAVADLSPAGTLGAAIALAATLAFWGAIYRRAGMSPLWALAFPIGAAAYAVIALMAIARGQRVEWRGRRYVSAVGRGAERAHSAPAPADV